MHRDQGGGTCETAHILLTFLSCFLSLSPAVKNISVSYHMVITLKIKIINNGQNREEVMKSCMTIITTATISTATVMILQAE